MSVTNSLKNYPDRSSVLILSQPHQYCRVRPYLIPATPVLQSKVTRSFAFEKLRNFLKGICKSQSDCPAMTGLTLSDRVLGQHTLTTIQTSLPRWSKARIGPPDEASMLGWRLLDRTENSVPMVLVTPCQAFQPAC